MSCSPRVGVNRGFILSCGRYTCELDCSKLLTHGNLEYFLSANGHFSMDKPTTIEVSDDDIDAFKSWMKQDPTLPDEMEEEIIRCFIIGRKGSLHDAKKRFLEYRRAVQLNPHLLGIGDVFDEDFMRLCRTVAYCYLPKKTPDGVTIFAGKLQTADPTGFSMDILMTLMMYMGMLMMKAGDYGNCEIAAVMDFTGAQVAHFSTLTPQVFASMAEALKINPLRVQGIYVTGVPKFAEWVLKLFIKMVPEKISKRVHYVANHDELHEHVPKEVLPEDFGGYEKSLQEIFNEKLMELQLLSDRLKIEVARVCEERERMGKNHTEVIETFRHMEID